MSFTPEQFQKVTGVQIDATTEQFVAAVKKKVTKTAEEEIATALLLDRLVTVHGWKISEGAAHVGLSGGQASTLAHRGSIVHATGYASRIEVWAALRSLATDKATLSEIRDDVIALLTEEDRTAHVQRLAVGKIVASRLGESSKPETVTALLDALMTEGYRSPVQAKAALPGIAKRQGIVLPKQQRKPRPGAETVAGRLTFVQALDAARQAITERLTHEDGASLTPAEAAAVESLMAALMRIDEEATVAA